MFASELELLVRARYPLVYVVTSEESRALEIIATLGARRQKKVWEWSCTGGLVPLGTSIQSRQRNTATRDPLVALDQITEQVEPALFVLKDFHPYLNRQQPAVLRKLRDIAVQLKNSFKTLILLGPVLELPSEIEKDVTVLNLPLPGRDELGELLDEILREIQSPGSGVAMSALTASDRDRLLSSAVGLTLVEAENVFARILVKYNRLSGDRAGEISAEKRQIIRKNGLLEYLEPAVGLGDVGGLASLKAWMTQRGAAFSPEAREFGLPAPRGVLLLGVQGCGKSLCAKAVADLWQLPLLRFDIGRMFGSLVGSSEENTRKAIALAESVAPAVLWVDEIEKAMAGTQGSAGDGGTASRVFGTFLTWLSEKTAPVFVVATANDISNLPPELLRKGRLDEIFFVDLPTPEERMEILAVHLRRRGRDAGEFGLEALAGLAEDFSGAELEEAIVSSLFDAFSKGEELKHEHLARALESSVPLAKTLREPIQTLRAWASGRARSAR